MLEIIRAPAPPMRSRGVSYDKDMRVFFIDDIKHYSNIRFPESDGSVSVDADLVDGKVELLMLVSAKRAFIILNPRPDPTIAEVLESKRAYYLLLAEDIGCLKRSLNVQLPCCQFTYDFYSGDYLSDEFPRIKAPAEQSDPEDDFCDAMEEIFYQADSICFESFLSSLWLNANLKKSKSVSVVDPVECQPQIIPQAAPVVVSEPQPVVEPISSSELPPSQVEQQPSEFWQYPPEAMGYAAPYVPEMAMSPADWENYMQEYGEFAYEEPEVPNFSEEALSEMWQMWQQYYSQLNQCQPAQEQQNPQPWQPICPVQEPLAERPVETQAKYVPPGAQRAVEGAKMHSRVPKRGRAKMPRELVPEQVYEIAQEYIKEHGLTKALFTKFTSFSQLQPLFEFVSASFCRQFQDNEGGKWWICDMNKWVDLEEARSKVGPGVPLMIMHAPNQVRE